MTDLLGQDSLYRQLRSALMRQSTAHAYLFAGASGTGKRTMALHFAMALLCPHASGNGQACQSCPACHKVAEGNHPDYMVFSQDKGFGVDEVRDIIVHQAGLLPYEGGRRVMVLVHADTYTPAAQQALLKTLEEPPSQTVFLLTATSPLQLLPTVRSRCVTMRMQPVASQDMVGLLTAQGIDHHGAVTLSCMAQGSVGKAFSLGQDQEEMALRKTAMDLLTMLVQGKNLPRLHTQLVSTKDDLAEILTIWQLFMRDAICYLGGMQVSQIDCRDYISQNLCPLGTARIVKFMGQVQQAQRMLLGNASTAMTIDGLLLQWTEGVA